MPWNTLNKAYNHKDVLQRPLESAWFSEQSGYTELFETNKRMAAWLISVFDGLGFDRIADSATTHTTTNGT